jgi:uncharacterized protein (TIGR02145 family)
VFLFFINRITTFKLLKIKVMKKCFLGILVLTIGFYSCSKDEVKSQNQETSRPSVPVQAGEVQIGNQIWMTKNLNVSRYRNGDPIPQVSNPTQWANLTTGAWCYYNNDPANGSVYGKLYNWFAVNDPRGLAPNGWHVPSANEYMTLTSFLGGDAIAGGKLKTTSLWNSPNVDATNSSGFSALSGGYSTSFSYAYMGDFGIWWTTSQLNTAIAYSFMLGTYDASSSLSGDQSKKYGCSVRCIKD